MNSCDYDLAARGRFELVHLEGGPYHSNWVPVMPGQQSINTDDLSFIQTEESARIISGVYQRSEKLLPDHTMVRIYQFNTQK